MIIAKHLSQNECFQVHAKTFNSPNRTETIQNEPKPAKPPTFTGKAPKPLTILKLS